MVLHLCVFKLLHNQMMSVCRLIVWRDKPASRGGKKHSHTQHYAQARTGPEGVA